MLIISLIAFSSVIMNLYNGIHVFQANRAAKANRLFLLLCITLCFWGFGYTFVISAETAVTAKYWRIVSAVGWCSFFSVFLQFALHFTNHQGWLRQRNIQWFLHIPALIFFIHIATSPSANFVHTDWGWVYMTDQEAAWQFPFIAYYTAYSMTAFRLIYFWGKRASTTREKKQAQIIVRTMLAVFILAVPFDSYLPLLGYPVLPIAILLSSVFVIAIWYSITHYRLMMLNFKTASDHILNNMTVPVLLVGTNYLIHEVNAATAILTGYEAEKLIGKPVSSLFAGTTENLLNQTEVLENNCNQNIEVSMFTQKQENVPCLLSIKLFRDEFGDVLGLIFLLHDITARKHYEHLLQQSNDELERKVRERTAELEASNVSLQKEISERKNAEAQIQYHANYDTLTGLPNRRLCYEQITQAIATAQTDTMLAVLFLDLDNFKYLNDTYGHAHGDLALQQTVKRINAIMPASDRLARIGGDEFLLLVKNSNRQDQRTVVETIVNSIRQIFFQPFIINGRESFLSVSIGIAAYPQDGTDADTLIKKADIAMYEAKNNGKNDYKFYSASMKKKVLKNNDIRNNLFRAIDKGELLLHYQPQIDVLSQKINGFEALLRWKRNDHSWISPAEFLPIAEEIGLIVPIRTWAMKQAFSQLKQWHDLGFSGLRMTVNVSARQLQEQNFCDQAIDYLNQLGLDPRYAEFEIMESMAFKSDKNILSMLKKIKNNNINISIDDFGTAYSSFMNIKMFSADRLKITKPFISGIGKSEKDAAIVSSIIVLAHKIGIKVIAQAVKTKEELNYLRQEKCDEIQGGYFYDPLPPEKIEALLYSLSFTK